MDKKIIAREYVSTTRCDLMEDGYWKAFNEVHDRVLYNGESEWIDEKVDAMAMDTDPQKAIQTAMTSTLNYIVQNVYQNGFSGLIDYRIYQKSLEQKKAEAKVDLKVAGN